MFCTLISNVPRIIIPSVHMACEIIIKQEGIPLGQGSTDYTDGGVLDVPTTLEVCVVSVYPPIFLAL